MSPSMDPEEVRNYAHRLQVRIDDMANQEYMLASDANRNIDTNDMESGLVMNSEWFGPGPMWQNNVMGTLEELYIARANEAATVKNKLIFIQETLLEFADKWESDEEAAAKDFDDLEEEMR